MRHSSKCVLITTLHLPSYFSNFFRDDKYVNIIDINISLKNVEIMATVWNLPLFCTMHVISRQNTNMTDPMVNIILLSVQLQEIFYPVPYSVFMQRKSKTWYSKFNILEKNCQEASIYLIVSRVIRVIFTMSTLVPVLTV